MRLLPVLAAIALSCAPSRKVPAVRHVPVRGADGPANFTPFYCPAGASYDPDLLFCVRGGLALGPFPQEMIRMCHGDGHGKTCDDADWPKALAQKYRGTAVCPTGTRETANGFCLETDDVFGPFVTERVELCLQQGGGAPCHTNRWSRTFADMSRRTPEELGTQAIAGTGGMAQDLLDAMNEILTADANLGYANRADAQHTRDLHYRGERVFTADTRRSHCVGITFQVLLMALNRHAEKTGDQRVWNQPVSSMKWTPFKNCWYVNKEADGHRCFGARDALVRYGMGRSVKDFEQLRPGDFVNYDRTSGTGHSVMFLGFLHEDRSVGETYRDDVIGFSYFSTQTRTNGAGKMKAVFSGRKCSSGEDCNIIKSSLVMGRVAAPAEFAAQSVSLAERVLNLFSMFQATPEDVVVPSRYLDGN